MRIEVLPRRTGLPIAIFLVWVTTPAFAQALFYDFNSTGQFTANFNQWNDSGGNNAGNYDFAECQACGVNGSGAVNVFQSTDTTATYKGGSWNFSTNGAALIVSALIHADGQANTGNKIQLGILNVNANGFYANAGVAFESFRFVPSSATTWSLREQYKPATGSTVETTLGSVANIIAGHWYKFTVSLTNSLATNYSAACALYDFGTRSEE